jgi:Predicted membrane protein (DUF2254)
VLSAIASAVAALTGFVVTVTVLVVRMATGTFSARYIRLWYRDRVLKGVPAVPWSARSRSRSRYSGKSPATRLPRTW